jgi:integrase
VKTREAVRDLPISPELEGPLAAHLARVGPGPDDLVFPEGGPQEYGAVRRAWDRTCRAAGTRGATSHDARHTFVVHAAMVGVPIMRLQMLLGHATATLSLRYMQHAPQAYLDEDAAAFAAHMRGRRNLETEARVGSPPGAQTGLGPPLGAPRATPQTHTGALGLIREVVGRRL